LKMDEKYVLKMHVKINGNHFLANLSLEDKWIL